MSSYECNRALFLRQFTDLVHLREKIISAKDFGEVGKLVLDKFATYSLSEKTFDGEEHLS
jgi:hypothetical protein